MKAILKYPGSKWRIADWIISHFPEHHSYLEPFFGSGAVLFQKKPSAIETVNDLDGEVINFFNWIKKDPEKLAKEIWLTPYSRKVYEEAYIPAEDSFGQAVNFCARLNMGHGFRTSGGIVGWKSDVQGREAAYAVRHWNEMPELLMLAAQRLKAVQIECRPAVDVIQRFNFENVLIYCDPPYLPETRTGKQYRREMTEEDHIELLEILKESKAKVILSGYESDLYNKVLEGWYKSSRYSVTQNAQRNGREVLWMNFESMEQMRMQI